MAMLQAIHFGIDTGYAASSAGRKPKRADGEAIADHITDVLAVGNQGKNVRIP
jgi:hypothetical protein